MNPIHNWNAWIGTDEAGKGDYFGPLVVAGVYVNAEHRKAFVDLGIADGKTLSNRRIRKLAKLMRHRYKQYIVVEKKMPPKYNTLYSHLRKQGQNLNHLLASLHAEVIQTLATRVGARHALVDRFSKNDVVTPQLMRQVDKNPSLQNTEIEVVQVPKAESDIAVAAASVIARDVFLTGIETLSQKYKIRLPRGSYKVTEAGREFIKLHGTHALGDVAKLHFNLTDTILLPKQSAFF